MDNYFKTNKVNTEISIQTNGTLLSESKICELLSRGVKIGISIDGCKQIHDHNRPTYNGNGSFEIIKRNISKVLEQQNQLSTISVNTKESIPYIQESVQTLNDLGVTTVKFNIMHPNKDNSIELATEEDLTVFTNNLIDGLLHSSNPKAIFDGNVRDKLLNLCVGFCGELCHSDGCTGGYTFVSIDRSGDVYPCELIGQPDVKIGNIFSGINLTEMIKGSISTNNYFKNKTDKKCIACPWWVYCRGGCTASILSYGKDASSRDVKECAVNRSLYPLLIKLILTKPESINILSGGKITISMH